MKIIKFGLYFSKMTITTFLMFEGTAEKAMQFYTGIFKSSQIDNVVYYDENGPGKAGTIMQAKFTLNGKPFMCIDSIAKHNFTFTPSMSLFVDCDSEAELDKLFEALSEKGKIMMALGNYGFSQKFGWTEDQFGVSWQLNLP
ncbi:VOC family protein [Flavobacterium noncentrifugens]|nr:VOC family protein [Flavobacterium noncentrifugens]